MSIIDKVRSFSESRSLDAEMLPEGAFSYRDMRDLWRVLTEGRPTGLRVALEAAYRARIELRASPDQEDSMFGRYNAALDELWLGCAAASEPTPIDPLVRAWALRELELLAAWPLSTAPRHQDFPLPPAVAELVEQNRHRKLGTCPLCHQRAPLLPPEGEEGLSEGPACTWGCR
jgi:hypothetical protein